MYIRVVVFQLYLFHLLLRQLLHGLQEVGAWIFAAQYEANLAAGVGGDGAVSVADHREE